MKKEKLEVLLAFAPPYLVRFLKPALEEAGFSVVLHNQGLLPKKSFNTILQATRDPSILAEWTRELLSKAAQDKSRFFLLLFRTDDKLYEEAAGFAKSLVAQATKDQDLSASVLSLGRLYGPGIPVTESGALGYLVKEFAEKDFLTVYGDGKDQDYYLFAPDAASGVAQALRLPHLEPAVAITSPLSVASESIAKLLFDLGGGRHEIRFHRGIAADEEKGPVEGTPLPKFKNSTSFNDGVMAQLKEESPNLKPHFKAPISFPRLKLPKINNAPRPKPAAVPAATSSPASLLRRRIYLTVLAVILLPLLYLLTEGGWAFFNLRKAKADVARLKFSAAERSLNKSAGSLKRLGVFFPPAKIAAPALEAAAQVLPEAPAFSQALANLQKSYKGEAVTPQTEEEFKNLGSALNTASQDLTVAWLDLQSLSPFWRNYTDPWADLIQEEALPALSLLKAFAEEGYETLGYQGERNYLLLFQNSAELQPGGGRTGTLADLKLVNGAVSELNFYNESDFKQVSSPLGQFNGISKFSDFRDGARAIADIFLKGTKTETQGVIGVDLRIAQSLLSVTGPLTLTEFDGQEVTAENFFEVTTREVETDFFPGTTKKKRFIQALGEGVINKLFEAEGGKYGEIAPLVWNSLKEKRLLLYFTNPAIYLSALENNFAGRLAEAQGDYLYPYDHNAGTKGTVWVKRSIFYRVFNTTRDGAMRAESIITWENDGTEAWPGGNYLNKTSLVVPQGSVLLTEKRNESATPLKNFFAQSFKGKTLFGTIFDVSHYVVAPPQSSQTLILTYDLPSKINVRTSPYRLTIQKQPGTVSDEFSFTFDIPFGYQATPNKIPLNVSLQTEENKLIFKGSLTTDLSFEIELKER